MKRAFLCLLVALSLVACSHPNQKQMVDVLRDAGFEVVKPTVNKDGGLDFSLPGGVCTGTLSPVDVSSYSLWLYNNDGSRINQFWSLDREELSKGAQTRHCFEPPECPSSTTSPPPSK